MHTYKIVELFGQLRPLFSQLKWFSQNKW
jgi:hypothetical protein